jgi:hypothetical protein
LFTDEEVDENRNENEARSRRRKMLLESVMEEEGVDTKNMIQDAEVQEGKVQGFKGTNKSLKLGESERNSGNSSEKAGNVTAEVVDGVLRRARMSNLSLLRSDMGLSFDSEIMLR